tara:strand:+ start:345 stop:821 length:477 start_codon:yes stop_codon:yes gene_type:complete
MSLSDKYFKEAQESFDLGCKYLWDEKRRPYKKILISVNEKDKISVHDFTGKFKNGTKPEVHGVYKMLITKGLDLLVLYVGKGEESTVGSRIDSHIRGWNDSLKSDSEATGKKLKSYMKDNNLVDLIIDIEFVEVKKADVHKVEKVFIAEDTPILNKLK